MTPTEADQLAYDISTSWPKALAPHVWAEAITHLDHQQARHTLRTILLNTDINQIYGPSIGQYLAEHRRIHTTTNTTQRTPCTICDGLGWQTFTTQRPGHPHTTTGVMPCRCTNGNQYQTGYRNAIDHNRALIAQYTTLTTHADTI
jgi:hypothetical protein